jgi:hypothetical protein
MTRLNKAIKVKLKFFKKWGNDEHSLELLDKINNETLNYGLTIEQTI